MGGSVTEISSSAQFEKVLRSNVFVMADFYATWCGPCKAIAPAYEQLSQQGVAGKLAFVKIDTDQNADITREHGVSAMPTFLLFRNGTVIETIRGANIAALKSAIAQATAGSSSSGGGTSASRFSSKGHRLGSGNDASCRAGAGWGSGTGLGLNVNLGIPAIDTLIKFVALYLITLFSFDSAAAAQASQYSVQRNNNR